MINKIELKEIIEDLKEVCKEAKISDDIIFSEACSYQRGILANQGRMMNRNEKEIKSITDKQAAFLSQLGYKGSYNLTSQQASKKIEKLK